MRIELEKRARQSGTMRILSPVLAFALTILSGAVLFALLGQDPIRALYVFFIEPLTASWSVEEILVKASPLIMIGAGLCLCYIANTWNIGAEGQFTMGAIAGSAIPVLFWQWESVWTLPAMFLLGALGGALWAGIPALLKVRFGANEILTSLMLVYVAQLALDWLVRGPWRDPDGFNFPESRLFSAAATVPVLGDGRLHLGFPIAILTAIILAFLLARTLKGFEIRVLGAAPRAGRFAGFSQSGMIVFSFLVSGALAGLAGLIEVAGPIGQLRPTISPGYGFTAIIVAFLGRLNPVGAILAGLVLAVSYIGGEAAQVSLGLTDKVTRVFQGMLLFFVLACDTLILYRIRIFSGTSSVSEADR